MKAEKKSEQFEPIVIELTIESEAELCSLWLRLNASPDKINSSITELKFGAFHNSTFFDILDSEIIKNKLKI